MARDFGPGSITGEGDLWTLYLSILAVRYHLSKIYNSGKEKCGAHQVHNIRVTSVGTDGRKCGVRGDVI